MTKFLQFSSLVKIQIIDYDDLFKDVKFSYDILTISLGKKLHLEFGNCPFQN